jgi:hypothetical protein
MKPKLKLLPCAVLACGLAGTIYGSDTNSGHGIVCVHVQDIETSPTIDDKTILLELKGHRYKRIDLAASCPELEFYGFAYRAYNEELCTTDALHVIKSGGTQCMIRDIVDITPEQAQALKKKK